VGDLASNPVTIINCYSQEDGLDSKIVEPQVTMMKTSFEALTASQPSTP